MENKKEIVLKLKILLKATRIGDNIKDLVLSEDSEEVTILFCAGGKRKVNISGDSGYEIIKDVMAAL